MTSIASVAFHRKLVNDRVRMSAYNRAIRAVVRPGHVVLDVGTGTGVLAMLAAQAGASRVYAIERESTISLARQLIAANHMTDRVQLIQADIRDITLDEPVDVITSELISKGVIGQSAAETLGWCRDRWLRPGGCMVPSHVRLQLAPFDAPSVFERLQVPDTREFGLDWAPLREAGLHHPGSARLSPDSLFAPAQEAYAYDALRSAASDIISAILTFRPTRSAVFHGFACWFVAELADQVLLSNAPPGTDSWDQLILPAQQAIDVGPDDTITVRLIARNDSKMALEWAWLTTITGADGSSRQWRQSTVVGRLLTGRGPRLGRRSASANYRDG